MHLRCLILLCAGVNGALALDPARALSQYHRRNWQVEDGLPRNYIMAVAPAGDGYLLVGTDEGLARFDGVRFVPFDLDPSLGLSRRWIGSLISARDGSLWVGTFDGWIYQFRGGRVETRFDVGATVFALLEDSRGGVWASTRTGVIRRAGRGFQPVPGLARPPETAWNVLSLASDGAVWAVTLDGLYRARDGAAQRVLANGPRTGELLAVRADRSGALWLGASRGLFQFSGTPVPAPAPGVPGPVVAILEDRDGVLWASVWGQGVFRVRAGKVDTWSARDRLPDDFIRTLYEDQEGNLWIGTRGGGLVRCKDTPIIPHGVSEGLGGNYSTTVAQAPDGRLWFGTWRGGLYRLGDRGFEEHPTPVPALYCAIRALAVDARGRPWIGNWEGLFGYDGKRYRNYAEAGSPYHLVSAILFDRQGRLWLATSNNGIFLFPPGAPLRPAASFLPGVEITTLFEDSQGRVWYGTPQGLGRVEDGIAPRPIPSSGIPRASVSAITEDSRGRVWAASLGGALYLVTPASMTVLTEKHGLPGTPLYRLLDDGAGSLWISSPKGILRIPAAQVDELLAGRRPRLDVALLDREDGMRTPECHHVSQPAGGKDPRGGVWFPTTRGFVRVGPVPAGGSPPPPVRIEEARADARALPVAASLRLEPGSHAIEIHYTALRFASAAKIRFRYRMEGFDPGWVEAGAERLARYSGLPPGDYRFLVSASLPGESWSEPPAALAVHQMPQFHQTGWFLALLGVASVAVAVALFRWRVHILKGRYAAVLGERNRIAREWHDTLLAGFAAITWQLEETLSRLKEFPEQAHSTVELALKMVQHYRAEARRVIWDLRETRPEGETLADAVRAALEHVTRGTAIAGAVEVSGAAVRLDDELERNLLRICQEAASNAKRHANPKRVGILLEYQPAALRLRVEDDGEGFEPEKAAGLAAGHFGLAVMRERAERFGGTLTLTSRPGRGTIIEASVPAAAAKSK